MKKILTLGVTVAALAASCASCTPTGAPNFGSQTPHTSAAADIEGKTIALVRSNDEGETRVFCSGVWIDEDMIVTADHCVRELEDGASVDYVTRGDVQAGRGDHVATLRRAAVLVHGADHDLAVLKADAAPAHGVARVGVQPAVGDPVQTMGHPLGLWWSYSTGNVAALRVVPEEVIGYPDQWWVQSTAPISPGNSGGGLFDMYGELIGIAHAYMPRGENVNFYIDARYVPAVVTKALEAAREQKSVTP